MQYYLTYLKTIKMTVEQIDQQFDNIAAIRGKNPIKLQLHTGVEGFESPEKQAIHYLTPDNIEYENKRANQLFPEKSKPKTHE